MKHCVKVLDTKTLIIETFPAVHFRSFNETITNFSKPRKRCFRFNFFQELKINFIALSWEPESLKLEEKEAQGEEGVRVGSTCRALVFKSMKP